ncbi:GNAT family N-acetyltransferase [Nonomuraea sp. H19]|uniref:GNAT family N-acetyltransferase n=1 Tax=Nonomuraea sp. H19 TaxID=3452206 RepID=UPI003F8B63CF
MPTIRPACRHDRRQHTDQLPRRPPAPAPIQLTGSALILREWDEADVPAMAELFDDPAVDRWTPLRAPFDQAARAYLASRAVQLITAYAYDSLAATHVILRISAGNTPSAAVAHAAGFHLTPAPPISRAGARDPLHTWLHRRSEQPAPVRLVRSENAEGSVRIPGRHSPRKAS